MRRQLDSQDEDDAPHAMEGGQHVAATLPRRTAFRSATLERSLKLHAFFEF